MTQTVQFTQQDIDRITAEAREFILLKEQQARLSKREKEIKSSLMKFLEAQGEPYGEEGQNRVFRLPVAVRGIAAIVRQRRVSTLVDETAAEGIARTRGIYERLFPPKPTLDEAAVFVAVEEGLLTDEDLDRIFPKKVVHAMVTEKDK